MKLHTVLAAGTALALAACSPPLSPAHLVYHVEGDYAAALVAETAYDRLPDCGSPAAPLVCSDAATRTALRRADDAAWAAIREAQAAVRTPGFAEDRVQTAVVAARHAVAAFADITAALKGPY